MLIDDLFNMVRAALRDANENAYPDDVLLPLYNRSVQEILAILRIIQADVSVKEVTFTGTGLSSEFELPTDWIAAVPWRVQMRSIVDATADYSAVSGMRQYDRSSPAFMRYPSTVGSPSGFATRTDGTTQYIMFNAIVPLAAKVDVTYFYKQPYIGAAQITTDSTPWLGLADEALARTLEMHCREGLEFTAEARKLWWSQTLAALVNVFGYRKLMEQSVEPSIWEQTGW